jgi:hypothetical protein
MITTRPWPETRAIFEDHVRSGIKNAPILSLIEWIENQKLTSELFSTTMHADLILGATLTFPMWEHMLSIRWINAGQVFVFQYFKCGSHPEMEKIVKQKEGIETLRLMLAYKFGLHRQPVANPAAPPNGGPE